MDFEFKPIEKDFLRAHIDDFTTLSRRNIENEYWEENHFLAELNNKWSLSFYVSSKSTGIIVGFIIASEKEHTIHIHKFVVDKSYQNKGIGRRMFDHLIKNSEKAVSLKVANDNLKAIAFYEKIGFLVEATGPEYLSMINKFNKQ